MENSANKKKQPKEKKKEETVDDLQPEESRHILYEILGVAKEATQDEIKKAYRQLALQKHPDKNLGDEKASENFQRLQKAYQVLSDPKKRERYDRFGDDGEDGNEFTTDDWLDAYEYFRAMHPEIEKQDIKTFAERYRMSNEEEEDLIDFYEENEGDVTHILEHIICSTNEDAERFIKFYEQKLSEDIIQKTKKFDQTKKKINFLPDEREEAKKEKKKLKEQKAKKQASKGPGNMQDLEKMILARKQNFGGFLNYMEAKYGGKGEEEDDGYEDMDVEEDEEETNINGKRLKKSVKGGPKKNTAQKRKKLE